jgi:hypothetical protein
VLTRILNTVSKFIEVGSAIVAFAANPSLGAAAALIPAVNGLVATVNKAMHADV